MKERLLGFCKDWLVPILMASLASWCAIASTLSARGLISVWREMSSYSPCFLLSICGAFVILYREERKSSWHIPRCIIAVASPFIVILFWINLSEDVFRSWKLNSISPVQWTRIVSDLEHFAAELPKKEGEAFTDFDRDRLPESLLLLGIRGDCNGGTVLNLNGEQSVYVAYGNKVRRWGIVVGNSELLKGKFRKSTPSLVATNAVFFLGPND